MKISAKQAPINPKIPPLAPTEIIVGKNIALKIDPPTAGTTNIIIQEINPWEISIADPTKYNAAILSTKCMNPACNTMADNKRHTSPSCTINKLSLAPIKVRVSALGPIIGFTENGSIFQPLMAIEANMKPEQIIMMMYVKKGRFLPVDFSLTVSNQALYL